MSLKLINSTINRFMLKLSSRSLSSLPNKYALELKQDVGFKFDDGLKYRHQPGRRHNPCVSLPYKLHFAVMSLLNKYRGKRFRNEIEKINKEFLEVFIDDGSEQSLNKRTILVDSELDFIAYEKNKADIRMEMKNLTKRDFLTYYQCAAYLASRLPANYAALSYIFNEIQHEEPGFVPSTVFDFGSGTGSTIWAADEYWKASINEYFCVDLNENMNELSRELLEKGTTHNEQVLDRTFYRQFLPVKHIPSYDLVVSAFSLLEMSDTRSRIYTVENLWHKTSGMLVLVEHGSKAGFTALMEARSFLLQISKQQLDPLTSSNTQSEQVSRRIARSNGSLVAPCPHDLVCPRQTVLHKKSYCNFSVNYKCINYGQESPGVKSERFAYVVIKKNSHYPWNEEQKHWPRLVQPVVNRTGHTICRVCDNDGSLKEIILSKAKSDKRMYKCGRLANWGDKLPARVVESSLIKSESPEE